MKLIIWGVFGPKIWTPISGWKMKIGASNKDRFKGLEKFFQTKEEKINPLSLEKKWLPPPLIEILDWRFRERIDIMTEKSWRILCHFLHLNQHSFHSEDIESSLSAFLIECNFNRNLPVKIYKNNSEILENERKTGPPSALEIGQFSIYLPCNVKLNLMGCAIWKLGAFLRVPLLPSRLTSPYTIPCFSGLVDTVLSEY